MATIESFGTTSLQLVGSNYLVQVGASPALTLLFGGVPVTAGQFGAWAPIGAEQTASGFEVVWQNGSNYVVWNVDSTGVFLSQSALLTSASAELQSLEPGFNQDLNGSGGITPRTVIESSGSTTLANVATAFVLSPTGSSLGPQLRMSGALVVAGQFGAWTPIGAEKMPNGTYLVFWKNGPDQYIAWTVDSGGNYLSQSDVLSGASIGLLSLEPGFNQDLNGSGGITPRSVVESSGSTTLANIATAFVLSPAGSSLGPQLRMSGALVTAGQFGAWTPIGAEQMANGGYQVVWKNGAADQYVVWNTGSFGNWLSQTGMMFGSSATLQLLEAEFNQDLNGVGGITARTVIEFERIDGAGHDYEHLRRVANHQRAGSAAHGVRRGGHGRSVRQLDADRRGAGVERSLSGRLEKRPP